MVVGQRLHDLRHRCTGADRTADVVMMSLAVSIALLPTRLMLGSVCPCHEEVVERTEEKRDVPAVGEGLDEAQEEAGPRQPGEAGQ